MNDVALDSHPHCCLEVGDANRSWVTPGADLLRECAVGWSPGGRRCGVSGPGSIAPRSRIAPITTLEDAMKRAKTTNRASALQTPPPPRGDIVLYSAATSP
jgi:hypothetical protein